MITLAATHEKGTTVIRLAKIEMLPIDILNGVRRNVWMDPIGFALKRAVPFSRQVRVSSEDIAFTVSHPRNGTLEHERYIVPTPPRVASWLACWDAGVPVAPLAPFILTWEESA